MPIRHTTSRYVLVVAVILAFPVASFAQVKVIISGGFATAYRAVLPEFERTTGIPVATMTGASQGTGPETISAQLRRGVRADVVILSREGLDDLIKDGRIVKGTEVDLAQTPIGLAVRSGAAHPDIGTVKAFTTTLLRAKAIALPGSTTGIYMTTQLFPRLGIADKINVRVTSRGAESTAMVAQGAADISLQPVSEQLHVAGIDFVGVIPEELQYVSVFSAAVVSGSRQEEAASRLIAFLASDQALQAKRDSGMAPPRKREPQRR